MVGVDANIARSLVNLRNVTQGDKVKQLKKEKEKGKRGVSTNHTKTHARMNN